jgi:putative ABC transport system permease protein
MGIPVVRGREFDARETPASPKVVLISETMARRFFAGADPIGQHLKVGLPEEEAPWLEIVGVVGDVHHRSLAEPGTPEMYVPYPQSPAPFMSIILRTEGDPVAAAPSLRAEVRRTDPLLPVSEMTPMRRVLSRSTSHERARGAMMWTFGALALALAAIGVYGVMAQAVAQRRQEIGIRMALGAAPRSIVHLFIGRGMTFALVGIAAGVLGALFLTRLLETQLFGITPTDFPTFAATALLLLAVALAACWLPARRAARVDPVLALRQE